MLRRAPAGVAPAYAPLIVHDVLRSPGAPLDSWVRRVMESRFAHDFSGVRIHTGDQAAESARSVNALAYTVGHQVVFDHGRYQPASREGRSLLAHELTHVVQQRGARGAVGERVRVESVGTAAEAEARHAAPPRTASGPVVARADPTAVGYVMDLGGVAGSGIQFWPTNVRDTRVGPVTVQGGLLAHGASRLNVIIGENLTVRMLARQLLALWTTATPFTPQPPAPQVPVPLAMVTSDELAQALLVYNQTYLPVPAMTQWRSGLRFPLPIEVDELTGVATLHPLLVRGMAGGFNAAWTPLLDQRAAATAAPQPAVLQADVQAFLASEPTALARGIHLGGRAITNAVAALPFVREAFRQLGAARFEVALELMNNLVNADIQLLAGQRDGAAILNEIRAAFAAAPGALSAAQQSSLTRANHMLGLVAGVAAQAPPGAARARAEKTVAIDTVTLAGSNHNAATDVTIANAVYSQCNVRFDHRGNHAANPAQTTAWIGPNAQLDQAPNCGAASAEERTLFQQATAQFGLAARVRAFFVPAIRGGIRANSVPRSCATGPAAPLRDSTAISNAGDHRTLSHELGHILINTLSERPRGIMGPGAAPGGRADVDIDDQQCTQIWTNA